VQLTKATEFINPVGRAPGCWDAGRTSIGRGSATARSPRPTKPSDPHCRRHPGERRDDAYDSSACVRQTTRICTGFLCGVFNSFVANYLVRPGAEERHLPAAVIHQLPVPVLSRILTGVPLESPGWPARSHKQKDDVEDVLAELQAAGHGAPMDSNG